MKTSSKLPIGIEDFEKIRKENFYYIDKTGLIKELLNNWGEVNLFTRPRRFGKTLTMSMLKCFLEIGCNQELFQGLKITEETELCRKYMGKFPVIFISLKGVEGVNYNAARAMMCSVIRMEAMRLSYLLDSDTLNNYDKEAFTNLLKDNMEDDELCNSLLILSKLLNKYYDKKVIILIDEYDVPLNRAYEMNYYDDMVALMRSIFHQGLKSNDSLYFAVLTGCLRISRESIFTGLNNMKVLGISDVRFDEYFGFTDAEVRKLLHDYGRESRYEVMKDWYDGYRFGNVDVYCPWDVINYCDLLRVKETAEPQAYWANSSSNSIVRSFIQKAKTTSTKREIEQLIAGEAVRKEIHQEMTYRDLDGDIEKLWSVLYATGYLTQDGESEGDVFDLKIPNLEIRKIFTQQIYAWFQETAKQDGSTLSAFCDAFENGDAAGIEKQFNEYLWNTISIRDTFVKGKKENFYHGILLGLLRFKENWAVSSNRESGKGYSDIAVEIGEKRIGIIIELKYSDDGNLERGCAEALKQIEKNNYEDVLCGNGMRTILKYGVACHKKQCKVVRA